jgi:DNA polymerase III epsilon subunit-like protein
MDYRFLIADTETSGFGKPPDAMAVEIAWMEVDDDLNILEQWHSLIDPEIPISPGASGVHHITAEHVADAPTIDEFFSVVHPGKITGNVVFIAHNAPFDRPYWMPWIENCVGEIDTLRVVKRLFPDVQNHKLQTLRYEFGLNSGDAHSALGDVITLHSLLRKIREEHGVTLAELLTRSAEPLFIHKMGFGKHRGQSIHSVPKDYLKWLRGTDNLDPDLAYTIDKVMEAA